MTSKQLKYNFGNPHSTYVNPKSFQNKMKQMQLAEMDVQMVSPQFLQSKTLKKSLKQYGYSYRYQNEHIIPAESDKTQKNGIGLNYLNESMTSMEDLNSDLKDTQKMNYTFISLAQTSKIKPAYQPIQNIKIQPSKNINQFKFEDTNTIFSAILKKGTKPKKSITFADSQALIKQTRPKQVQRKIGAAQTKLKQLFNKPIHKSSQFANQNKKVKQDIEQQIQQSINQYAEQQFDKYSQQSGIKQSIRQQLGGSSGYIKQSIRQSIRQSIGQSSMGRKSKNEIAQEIQSMQKSHSGSKDHISQFIASYKSGAIKEEIFEELSGSKKSGSDIYQQIFEEYEDELSKSKTGFKKSNNFKDSDGFSKSFRKKTNVVKSIRLAEQINSQAQLNLIKSKQNIDKNDEFQQKLIKQQQYLNKKKSHLENLMKKPIASQFPTKNKNLLYEFKVQLNKLLTSENFQSKLRKLTSFINFERSDDMKGHISSLQDNILKNIMGQLFKMKQPDFSDEVFKLKEQYDLKLKTMLKDQQINLRVEMDQKLHQKDMELKKMIAELQQRFSSKTFASQPKINNFIRNDINYNQSEIQSDYSIDSADVSWKADLWQLLPQFEKKKLYQKQTKEVTNFLTDIMMNEIKQQSLNRQLDISFEFPEEDEFEKSSQHSTYSKSSFSKRQFEQPVSSKKQSIFPDFVRPKQKPAEDFTFGVKPSINQYAKVQGEVPIQLTKKDVSSKQGLIKIFSKYKSAYMRKQKEVIQKLLNILVPSSSSKRPTQNLQSLVQQFSILSKSDINVNQLAEVRAYEQQLIWTLVSIITKQPQSRQTIKAQLQRQYERVVICSQVRAAQSHVQRVTLGVYEQGEYAKLKNNIEKMSVKGCPVQVVAREEAVKLVIQKQETKIQEQLTQEILKTLMQEFAKEFPSRKK